MTELKLSKVGNSVGVVIPKEILARLNVGAGDTLYLTEGPDGMKLTPYNPRFARHMEVAEKVMKERRNLLRSLA